MKTLEIVINNLKGYKYVIPYILIFIVFGFIYKSPSLMIISTLVLSLALALIFKDRFIAMYAIGKASTGDNATAEKSFKKLIDRNTKNSTVYLYYANIQLLKNDPDSAILYVEKGLKYKHNDIIHKNLMLVLSSSYWVKGDLDKAISILEDLRVKYEYVNYNVLATLGYLYYLKGDMEKAREISMLALEDNINSASAYDNLGQIELSENNLENAKEHFIKALSLKEDSVDSLFHLGVLYEKEGDYENAMDCFTKAKSCVCSVVNTVTPEDIENHISELSEKMEDKN